MSKMLYLVTGAAGFLGSHVCHQFWSVETKAKKTGKKALMTTFSDLRQSNATNTGGDRCRDVA